MPYGHLINQLYQDKLMKIKIIFILIFIANIANGQLVNLFKIVNNSVVVGGGNFASIATTNVARGYKNLTTSYDSTSYKGWFMTYATQNKRAIIFRRGSVHIYDGSSVMT